MQAIILAAGMGKRLKEHTQNNTKCMVKVGNSRLIDRMLEQLDKKNLSRIVVVTGYKGDQLKEYVDSLDIKTKVEYVHNPDYATTNNIYSLSLTEDYLVREDTLLFESDIIFEESVIDCLIDDERKTLALVDKYEPWMDGTCVRLDEYDRITDFISGKNFDFKNTEGCYKTVNIYKFSEHFSKTHYVPFMRAYLKAMGENEYYEQVLRVIAVLDEAEICCKRLAGQKWYEIDDEQDLDIAEVIFAKDENERLKKLSSRYGGYWRFTGLRDFCYLVNPYYPPRKLLDEMKASFETLVTQYPSGMRVNSLLAAKTFGLREEMVVVGNGAAELIKALMERFDGSCGFVKPTFEEYPNRYNDAVIYDVSKQGFVYDEDDVISFFDDKAIKNLVIINPDNPTGNYIGHTGIIKLVNWTESKGIRLIIDESFVDFADEKEASLFDREYLSTHKLLYVMKSISKSFGVPGIRLGILTSGDLDMISSIKKDVAIWNINSFGEFYLQIAEKYKKQYAIGMEYFRQERKRFKTELEKIDGLNIFDSQANYFMLELTGGRKAHEICEKLLKREILIKDLSSKMSNGEFIRIAIRDRDDNNELIRALKESISV